MKKGFMIILTFVLSFMCMMGVVKAEDGLSCTFLYDPTGENSDSTSVVLPITFYNTNGPSTTVNGKTLELYSSDGRIDTSKYPYVKVSDGNGYYIAKSNNYSESLSLYIEDGKIFWDCSLTSIYAYVREKKDINNKKVKFLILSSSQIDGTKLIDKTANDSGANKAYFKGGFDFCTLNSIGKSDNAEKCRINGLKQSNIIINKDANGNWYASIDGYKEKINENASGDYVWEKRGALGYVRPFVITKDDWSALKSAVEAKTNEIYVTAKNKKFVITVNAISDGDAESVKVSADYSVSGDSNYVWNQVNPSKTVGACVNYLGSASTPNTPANYLNKAFFIMKIVAILGTILFNALDFAGEVTSNKDNLIPTAVKCAKRIVIVILLLLLPTFIDLAGQLIGKSDILCGIK